MDTMPVEFDKPKQISPAKIGEQNLKVDSYEQKEWNVKLVGEGILPSESKHESLEP